MKKVSGTFSKVAVVETGLEKVPDTFFGGQPEWEHR